MGKAPLANPKKFIFLLKRFECRLFFRKLEGFLANDQGRMLKNL
jgi:hypothetical protein